MRATMRIILLQGASSCERKEEVGNALTFVSAVISIYQNRDFNAATISKFLEQHLQEFSSKSNRDHPCCWRCDIWGSGAGCLPVPPKGLGGSLQSGRLSVYQGLTLMVGKVQAELSRKEKKCFPTPRIQFISLSCPLLKIISNFNS